MVFERSCPVNAEIEGFQAGHDAIISPCKAPWQLSPLLVDNEVVVTGTLPACSVELLSTSQSRWHSGTPR